MGRHDQEKGKGKQMQKKLLIFAGGAIVIAGALVYVLGIYPPVSGRDGQGAIGQRQVYRDGQPRDAAVTPGAAPVAAKTRTAAEIKKMHEISTKLASGFVSQVAADLKPELIAQLTSEMTDH